MAVQKVSKKTFRVKYGHGFFATYDNVTVKCVIQFGKYCASVKSLNARLVGIGDTEEEAYAKWSINNGNAREVVLATAK